MNQLADAQYTSKEQIISEMDQVRSELQEMKETLNRLKVQPVPRRRGSIFGRRRRAPVQVEPEKPKLSLEDLLPLLPHLSSAFPQLKNPKVAESIKVLSNPAVIAMIQQFLANSGLTGKSVTQASRKERRFLGWGKR
ncbi:MULTISPECIES: hypothetical protein [Bacillales]|jgi:hypothetical protein|uniref:Transposase n=2 Tax=Brevibacillus TaxID=55080 RepID=A0AA48MD56_9BACL|nr:MULTISPECIES: hypothetical protein [Bacillales]MBR8661698.1 hypothetical protein [Brevibacillus sp. NL20B1]REK65566.1 MAG: hypothetical protein DF221_05715 [Brevibacillus sp.]NNV03242.1 hypothetical protein [Brevibacillus sp. MCWH]UFJ62560.1 hypothetical protein IRT44_07240 [Anoxybacillus sediminis]CAJ1004323.1 Transposase [Brevibacillus aydinogluensis]